MSAARNIWNHAAIFRKILATHQLGGGVHGSELPQYRALDPARRAPIQLGTLTIDPATRQLVGPAGTAVLRPQVMRVLLTLADAEGAVVSRDAVAELAWEKRFVADDSLNGAVYELRRAFRTVGVDHVRLLTVPKTGYRLVVDKLSVPPSAPPAAQSAAEPLSRRLQRRTILAGGAGAAVFAGGAYWLWRGSGQSVEVTRLLETGLIALRQGLPSPDAQGVAEFRAATRLDPDNARAWGLLALALRAAQEFAPVDRVAALRNQAEEAARRALALDRQQADAQTALALLEPSFGRWSEAEARLARILARAPDNPFAVQGLATLLMSTGQVRRCLQRLDWLNAHYPMSPNLQFRRVYTLWSAGRLDDADATADRALQQWPQHPAVWFARLWTFAFTDRAERAQAMLWDEAHRPAIPPPVRDLLALSLMALENPGSRLVEAAISGHIAAASRGPGPAVAAIMFLSALGAGPQSLEVAQGFLLQRGDVVVRQRHSKLQPDVTDHHHRMTMMLWIPATANLRAQPGFLPFCEDLGLGSYWRSAGVRPDFLR